MSGSNNKENGRKYCVYPGCGKETTSSAHGMPLCWDHLVLFTEEGKLSWEREQGLFDRFVDWTRDKLRHRGGSMKGEEKPIPIHYKVLSIIVIGMLIGSISFYFLMLSVFSMAAFHMCLTWFGFIWGLGISGAQLFSYLAYWKEGDGWLSSKHGKLKFWLLNVTGIVLLIIPLILWGFGIVPSGLTIPDWIYKTLGV